LPSARLLSISPAGDMAVLFGPQNVGQVFGARTLARVPMAGGARRDLLDGVVDADWIPGSDSLAVIRDPGGGKAWTVEFPAGHVVHEARAAWSLRVSPDGMRVAFFEGPVLFDSAPEAMITTIDRAGRKSTLTRNWSGFGLAWARSGRELWFSGTRGGLTLPGVANELNRSGPQLRAVSLDGVERTIYRAPDWLVLHDIAADGTVLLSRNTVRIGLSCQAPGEAAERDLSWLLASSARSISSDGRTVVFSDFLTGRTSDGYPTIFRRGMDGSPAVALGEGNALGLSPDAQWVLATLKNRLVLLPTGVGSVKELPAGPLERFSGGAWLSDSKHVVFTGAGASGRPRVYQQEVPDGLPVALTPEGTVSGLAAVRNDRSILVRAGDRWLLYDAGGGEPQAVRGLTSEDLPLQWSADGRQLYLVHLNQGAPPPEVPVWRIGIADGKRNEWKRLVPGDRTGVESLPATVRILRDGQSYCYSYLRRLGDLYTAEGLK
jgi:hypothetical protein